MKLPHPNPDALRPREDGAAVIVMLVLLSIILIYITANMRSLKQLHQELNLTERRQVNRLNPVQPVAIATNQIAAATNTSTNATATPATP